MLQSRIMPAAALVLALASGAWAGGSQNMAGCGLGSMLFKESGTGPQILAATTNGSTYSQLFGITSGTSGCTSQGWSFAKIQRERYVAANFRSLSRELAVGKGEFASSLASVMGCKAEVLPRFLAVAKEKHTSLFPSEGSTPSGMLRTLETTIAADGALAPGCTL